MSITSNMEGEVWMDSTLCLLTEIDQDVTLSCYTMTPRA